MTHDGRNHDDPVERAEDAARDSLLDRQLEALLEQLEIEKAPASLTRRLHRIPDGPGDSPAWWRRLLAPGQAPRWALVPALAAVLLVIGVVMTQPRQPSQQEILQARHDLAVAFAYIDKAGVLTGQEIRSVLGGELRHSVKDNLSKSIPFTEQFRKEETT